MESIAYPVSFITSSSIISQFKGSFLNQTISVPFCDSISLYEHHLFDQTPYSLQEHFYVMWMVMFCLSCLSMGLFMFRCCSILFNNHNSDVVDDMRMMMSEISELSETERQQQSENYYILTNLLVNRFRIEVYEKILK
jgi:hypothetical protein